MIKSMTAFARAEKIENDFAVGVEIRSYNSRYLDVALRVPHGYNVLEEKIKSLIAGYISRGRVEIKLLIKDYAAEAAEFEINEPKAEAYHRALMDLKQKFDLDGKISLDHFTSVAGIISPVEAEKDLETQWQVIKACIIQAAEDLNEMREREGAFIYNDFLERLGYIEESVDLIAEGTGDMLVLYRERLKERITSLTQGLVEIDPGRILQEAAFLADRSDISEEIVRARSHIEQFRSIMDSKEAAGRKLNFLLQEFNREFNTMGSKAGNAEISHRIVAVKSEIEKLREQVQNVE